MPMRDRLRAVLSRIPFGLGVPGTMDHPAAGGLARDRDPEDDETEDADDTPER
jgi:hypothetical protein